MKRKLLTLVASVALAAPAAAAETYDIDANHANVGSKIRHLMSQVTGHFTGFEGTVHIDRDQPAALRSSSRSRLTASIPPTRGATTT
jgi:polyisoprenoid-binding protein YceI